MGKQTTRQKPSRHRQKTSRSQSRTAKKAGTLRLRFFLILLVIVLFVLLLRQASPGLVITMSVVIFIVFFLLFTLWYILHHRHTSDKWRFSAAHQLEAVQLEETAQAIDMRPVEIEDFVHLGDKEFEYFTGALLETMGVASELECIGGARDGGIDLRGKDQFNRLFIVQCKRLFGSKRGKVTPEQTRSFRGAMQRWKAGEAWFVTTSSFTSQAKDEVSDLTYTGQMTLVDGNTLITYTRRYWDVLPAQWQWRLAECMLKSDQRQYDA